MKIDPVLAGTVAAVVDEGTLDAAARRLRITPSAVSQRVKTLEQQLGRVLLVRAKPARATEAGEAVLRFARRYALLEHDALAEFGLRPGGARTRLPLAVNADSLATWFLAPLARLAERHPVDFDLHRADQDDTTDLLESGAVMAAVTSRAAPVPGCTVTPLAVLRYRAVASPAYLARWLPEGPVAGALAEAPCVDFDRHDRLQESWLRAVGAAPEEAPRHYVPTAHDFARAVELGLGWAMLPVPQAAPLLAAGTVVPLGGPDVPVPLHWQQWKVHSPLLAALTAEVTEEAARVLGPAPGARDREGPAR